MPRSFVSGCPGRRSSNLSFHKWAFLLWFNRPAFLLITMYPPFSTAPHPPDIKFVSDIRKIIFCTPPTYLILIKLSTNYKDRNICCLVFLIFLSSVFTCLFIFTSNSYHYEFIPFPFFHDLFIVIVVLFYLTNINYFIFFIFIIVLIFFVCLFFVMRQRAAAFQMSNVTVFLQSLP